MTVSLFLFATRLSKAFARLKRVPVQRLAPFEKEQRRTTNFPTAPKWSQRPDECLSDFQLGELDVIY
jgi:hypothetical protein